VKEVLRLGPEVDKQQGHLAEEDREVCNYLWVKEVLRLGPEVEKQQGHRAEENREVCNHLGVKEVLRLGPEVDKQQGHLAEEKQNGTTIKIILQNVHKAQDSPINSSRSSSRQRGRKSVRVEAKAS